MRLLLVVMLFTISCQSAQQQDHSSILNEKNKTVRVVLLDARRNPIAGSDVELTDGKCAPPNCPAVVGWTQKSGSDGSVAIPRNLIRESILVGTSANEPRELPEAQWDQDRGAWTLPLIGRVATICSRYDSSTSILVAEDWRSAKLDASGDLGVMHCEEGKGVFRTCAGRQIPDAGYFAIFSRDGEKISVRLSAESIAGPRDVAQMDCFRFAKAQAPPRDLKSWAVEYSLTGGLAGLNRHLRLTDTGELSVSANSESGSHISTRAPAQLVAKVGDFLKTAQPERPANAPMHPDSLNSSLALITGGSKYELEVPEDVGKALDDAMESVFKTILVGTWWESEWKLCRPAAQLTADQMDPPIENLTFQNDGHFSVTWKGGGARAYGDPTGKVPHTAVPDYSGKYSIQPDHSNIHLTFENGIYTPRDFAGDGFFQIDKDKLVLGNVWFGTYKAKQKPDICWLTFARSSDAAH